jgi:hypothetical protein
MDTGIGTAHREFTESGKIAPGYNTIDGTANVEDRMGHGTHVAGIIGAGRGGVGTMGVAFDARLLPIKVLSDSGSGSTTYLDRGIRYAIGRASIANFSLGATTSYDSTALQEAVRAGLLIVAAAGNESSANPNWPARFAKETWANGQIIAVGAVDANNVLAAFSNKAGDTAAWFLVAPGVRIMSSYLDGQYAYMSGTSMATPVVTGAAALLKQLWPSLRADQIASILFMTATDLGTPGIDEVYGRGLLNVAKAIQPVGTVTTTTYNGRTITVLNTSVSPTSATSKLWSMAAAGNLKFAGVDAFSRDFSVDLSSSVSRPAALSLSQVFGDMDRRSEIADQVLANGALLSSAYSFRQPQIGSHLQADAGAYARRLDAFSLAAPVGVGIEAALGTGGMASRYFGAGSLENGRGLGFGDVPALANPYFALVPGASHAALAQDANGFKLKFGMLSSGFNQIMATQEGPYLPGQYLGRQKAGAGLFEISRSFGAAAMALSFSRTQERDAYLGARSSGALAFGGNGTTSAVQMSAAYLLAPALAVAGQASFGYTPASAGNASLITDISAARTNAFSLAVIASDRLHRGDRFSVAFSQPMRTYAGQITTDMVVRVSGDGVQERQRMMHSMVPTGRELRTEFNYHLPLGRMESAGVTWVLRSHPNNLAEASMEKLVGVRWMKQF